MPTKEFDEKLKTFVKFRKNYSKQERKKILKSLIHECLMELSKGWVQYFLIRVFDDLLKVVEHNPPMK